MLDITRNSIGKYFKESDHKTFATVQNPRKARFVAYWLFGLLFLVFIVMFLPWTQNINVTGTVTSLRPGERPHTIHATIPGRIEEWHVMEGDRVLKGDTIVKLSEIKTGYFNPELLSRMQNQIKAREDVRDAYKTKVNALRDQLSALKNSRDLKLQQVQRKVTNKLLKVRSDSMAYAAAQNKFEFAENRFERNKSLFENGLISKTKWQDIEQNYQQAQAGLISAENQFASSQNDYSNEQTELTAVVAQFAEKIAKSNSNISSAESQIFDTEQKLQDLRNKLENLSIRSGFRYIKAPQDGYITKAQVTGIGETVKEGEPIISLMPKDHQLAAEIYVRPVDLPLIKLRHKVRLIFDGWPVIVVSGWPDASYGTFSGEVVAVDNMISDNGKYRVLVVPDNDRKAGGVWPKELRIGSGVRGMALLNVVPVWKELWRNLNGFPPEWYDKTKEHPYIHDKKNDPNSTKIVN